MVSISVDLDLDDISSVIEFSGNSEAERREVLDFVLNVDRGMCEVVWTLELIAELANSVAQETIDGEFRKTSIPVPMDLPVPGIPDATVSTVVAIPLPNLAKALAAIDPEIAVQIYAESQELRKQELEKIEQAKAKEECDLCGHTRSLHIGGHMALTPGPEACEGPFLGGCECPIFKDKEQ